MVDRLEVLMALLNSMHFCLPLRSDHWKDWHSACPTHLSAHSAADVLAPPGSAMSLLPAARKPAAGGWNPSSVLVAHAAQTVVVVAAIVVGSVVPVPPPPAVVAVAVAVLSVPLRVAPDEPC